MNWHRTAGFLVFKIVSCTAFFQSPISSASISPLLLSNSGLGTLTSSVPPAQSCGLSTVAGQGVGTAVGGELGAKLGSVLGIILGNGLGVGLGELFGALAGAEIGSLTGHSVCASGVSCPIKKQLCPQCQISPARVNALKSKRLPKIQAGLKVPNKVSIPSAGVLPNMRLNPNAGAFLSGRLLPNNGVLPNQITNYVNNNGVLPSQITNDVILSNPSVNPDASLEPVPDYFIDDVSINTLAPTDENNIPYNLNIEAKEEDLIAAFELEFQEALNEATELQVEANENGQNVPTIDNNEFLPNNLATIETPTIVEANCASIPDESAFVLPANTNSITTEQSIPFQEVPSIPVATDSTVFSGANAFENFFEEASGDINQSTGTIDTNAYENVISDAPLNNLQLSDYSLPENTPIPDTPVSQDGTVFSGLNAYENFFGEAPEGFVENSETELVTNVATSPSSIDTYENAAQDANLQSTVITVESPSIQPYIPPPGFGAQTYSSTYRPGGSYSYPSNSPNPNFYGKSTVGVSKTCPTPSNYVATPPYTRQSYESTYRPNAYNSYSQYPPQYYTDCRASSYKY